MRLAPILQQYAVTRSTLPIRQHSALNASAGCRTKQYGHLNVRCADCRQLTAIPHSCGHRNCPRCLNHCTSLWLDRQCLKLLPCSYFMVTFTLPASLRPLARRFPISVYNVLMDCAANTLKAFAANDKTIGDRIGMTAILHTHNRAKEFHPHVHIVMPGGGLSADRRHWREKPGKYLFNGKALAIVFRARVLAQLTEKNLFAPKTPRQWVVHCKRVGSGLPALKYLSRYLYRGVMPEKDILSMRNGSVRFRYRDNQNKTIIRVLSVERFTRLILQHVLPKGFRRIRDYGFLNGNAQHTLKCVQWALNVMLPNRAARARPDRHCTHCGGLMKTATAASDINPVEPVLDG